MYMYFCSSLIMKQVAVPFSLFIYKTWTLSYISFTIMKKPVDTGIYY
jgi:hypothetical protein